MIPKLTSHVGVLLAGRPASETPQTLIHAWRSKQLVKCGLHSYGGNLYYAHSRQAAFTVSIMSSSAAQISCKCMLDLPAELRDLIYYLVLATGRNTLVGARRGDHKTPGARHEAPVDLAHARQPPLLLLCHQIRLEALRVYFANTHFRIRTRPTDEHDPTLRDCTLQSITRARDALTIRLHVPPWIERLGLEHVRIKSFDVVIPDKRSFLMPVRLSGKGQIRWAWDPTGLSTRVSWLDRGTWMAQRWPEAFKLYVLALANACGEGGVSLAEVEDMLRCARIK